MMKPMRRKKVQINKLLARMKLEEKVAQLTGIKMDMLMGKGRKPSLSLMKRHLRSGIGQISLSAGATELPPERVADNVNIIQRYLMEETRLGIPAIVNDEGLAGFGGMGATHFPQAIGIASTWIPELARKMAEVIRQHARAVGTTHLYDPLLDVARDPRWGRTEETFGESPYLVACIGVAYLQGLQGDDLFRGVVGTPKHFVGYSFPEGGRNCAPVHAGERELREVFLFPFEAAVKTGNAQVVMVAYHEIDGMPCPASKKLLTDILRDEWGFPGIVVADWGTISMLHTLHGVAASPTEAGMLALGAGVDIELPVAECYGKGLVKAIRQGKFNEVIVTKSVKRHLRVKSLLGLFDNPYVNTEKAGEVFDRPEHRALARELACHSITLLKNENRILPLKKNIKSLAVVGPNADSTRSMLGDYSYTVYRKLKRDSIKIVSVLEGIKGKVSSATKVHYAQGCDVMGNSISGFREAINLAKKTDVVVAVMGGRSALHDGGTSGENLDRAELKLPGVQEEFLKELHRTGKPVVAVIVDGRPLAIEWLAEHLPAVVEAWLPGEEGGNAVADVLFGDYNPGGKLPVSLLRTAGQAPTTYDRHPSSFAPWAKYVFTERNPLYPFGHGLSYTEFRYSNLKITPRKVVDEKEIIITCEVENTGDCIGDEVVQLYIHDLVASVTRPIKELKGFQRITLEKGEKKRLTFTLPVELLSFYDGEMKLIVEAGEFEVMVGSSSEDIRLQGRFILSKSRYILRRCRFFTKVFVEGIENRGQK